MSFSFNKNCIFSFLCLFTLSCARVENPDDFYENRPYEFSFNIVDFQHRYEKKDVDGIVTGEYGFITADGVYHETGYATDKNGNFIITRMKNRKISSLKDAQEVFKDRPEAARKLLDAVARSCSGCKIPIKDSRDGNAGKLPAKKSEPSIGTKVEPIVNEMVKVLTENAKAEYTTTAPVIKSTAVTLPKPNEPIVKEMVKVLTENAKTEYTTTAPVIKSTAVTLPKPNEPIVKQMVKVLTENAKTEYTSTAPLIKSTAVALPKSTESKTKSSQNVNRIPNQENERKERVLREMIKSAKKIFANNTNEIIPDEITLEKMANDLYYRFNYTITSHGHHESGYRGGNKDGSYRARSEDGVDTRVRYVSNEFGHQPNITFHSRSNETKEGEQSLKGYSFLWYFS